MRLICTSDTHGFLTKIPECDVLIHAGDITPAYGRYAIGAHDYSWNSRKAIGLQFKWVDNELAPWLKDVPAKHIVIVGGNHDFCCEGADWKMRIDSINRQLDGEKEIHYLQDSGVDIDGVRFWGVPWVPNLPNWAFHKTDEGFQKAYDKIPEDTDILVSHGPPHGILDDVNYPASETEPRYDRYYQRIGGPHHVGAPFLSNKLSYDLNVKLFVCGHIHEHHGFVDIAGTLCANVACMDGEYDRDNPQAMLEVDYQDDEVVHREWIRTLPAP